MVHSWTKQYFFYSLRKSDLQKSSKENERWIDNEDDSTLCEISLPKLI